MKRLQGAVRTYAWGSPSAIPSFFGYPSAGDPIAEVWFGAHPDGSAFIVDDNHAPLFAYDEPTYRPRNFYKPYEATFTIIRRLF